MRLRVCRSVALVAVLVLLLVRAQGQQVVSEPRVAKGNHMDSVNIVSYNIRHGSGMDGRLDLSRTAAVLEGLKPDLVALQEVDSNCGRSRCVDQAAELGAILNMSPAFGKFMDLQGGEYGLAILSRYPILKTVRHVLPTGAEPRCALEIEVQPPDMETPLSFVCIHLDWTKDTIRITQLQALLDALKEPPHPIILAGDFNAEPAEPSMQLLRASGWHIAPKQGPCHTWPAASPNTEIDYVVTRGLDTNTFCTVIAEADASDHRPIQAHITRAATTCARESTTGGWELAWEESFSGPELDDSRWTRCPRGKPDWKNTMSLDPQLLEIKNGLLRLRGIVNENRDGDPAPYLTAGITSRGKFSFKYGKVQIRARFKSAQGAWPALWMLGNERGWPDNGEIDLMEHLNFDEKVYQTVHSEYTVKIDKTNTPRRNSTTPVNRDDWNTYGCEWDENKIVFTVNGTPTHTYPRVPEKGAKQWPFNQPFYFILSMQIGGNWVNSCGPTNPAHYPAWMDVDWVRVYTPATSRPPLSRSASPTPRSR